MNDLKFYGIFIFLVKGCIIVNFCKYVKYNIKIYIKYTNNELIFSLY